MYLDKAEVAWNEFVVSGNTTTARAHPAILKARVLIELHYFGEDDFISATGRVSDLQGFLSLSEAERKNLVSDTVNLLKSRLQLGPRYVRGTRQLQKKQPPRPFELTDEELKLTIILRDLFLNDRNEEIHAILSSDDSALGDYGQASFFRGTFVYSEPYYLKLVVKEDGLAVSGDPTKFVIEKKQ